MAGFGGEEIGKAIGGFFGDKMKRHYYSDELHNVQEQQALGLGGLKAKADAAAAAYAAAVAKSTPEIEAINRETMGTLGDLAKAYQGFDPASTYERIRGGNIASLADQFVNLATMGQEGDKARLAALGYGGRGPSSYESILRSDRISRNIAPVLNTIFSTLGTDTTNLNNNRLANLAATLGLLRERRALPGEIDARALLPYQAEAGMFADQVGIGGQLGEAIRGNVAGFENKKNKWANFFEQGGKAADKAYDAGINLYSGGMLGGGGGGLGGIMGGGGGGGGGGDMMSLYGAQNIRNMGYQPPSNWGVMDPYSQGDYLRLLRGAQGYGGFE